MQGEGVCPASDLSARIMVIDDEQILAWALSRLLTRTGYDVITFNDPVLALDELRQRPVDLVISDVFMPQMSGIDLAIQLRQHQPQCKILLLSGQASNVQMLARASAQGCDLEVFPKPIPPNDLLHLVALRVTAN